MKRRIERGIEDPLIRAVKSDVEDELKRYFPGEVVTDEAGRYVRLLEFILLQGGLDPGDFRREGPVPVKGAYLSYW